MDKQTTTTAKPKKKKQRRHRQVSPESEEKIFDEHFKHKRGPKFKHDRFALLKDLLNYIKKTPIPILAEFAYERGLPVSMLRTMPELATGIEMCHQKKEAALEKGGLNKKYNSQICALSLKQLGWSDVIENRLTGREGGPVETVNLNSKEVPVDLEAASKAYLHMITGK